MQTRSRTKSLQQGDQTTSAPAPTAPKAAPKAKSDPPPQNGSDDDLMNLSLNSTVRLRSGALMPRLGFGVYQARGEECKDAVTAAVNDGYRHIDSAQAYHNEHHVAAGLKAAAPPVARKDLFLTTKFMPGHSVPGVDTVYGHLRKSLGKFVPADGPDAYIDLMLIHAPRPNEAARARHWAALVRAQEEGWIKDIGVSNFSAVHLEQLAKVSDVMPAVNQIELHPFCQQRDIVKYCREKGIVVQAYCPLVRAKKDAMENPTLVNVADKYKKTITQVLVRWSLQKGFIPLPKSVTPARIKENMEVYDFVLDKQDMDAIDALDQGGAGAVSWNPVDHV